MMLKKAKAWIEAMRLRTLPVSTAGVISSWALAVQLGGNFRWAPAVICLAFAVMCQIVSNFANEYYDYKAGVDRKGRSGPRRGVTEGDISPAAMKLAAFALLAIACIFGLSLIIWGGWWLLIPGIAIALGALAYSAGPYPLSRHALGEVAVLFFFGIIPVNLSYYLITGSWDTVVAYYSVAVGLMAANVLIVNNYRDAEEDVEVGKRTLANVAGRKMARFIYLADGVAATLLSLGGIVFNFNLIVAPAVYLAIHLILWKRMVLHPGEDPRVLNPMLGKTAIVMFVYSLLLFI